MNHFIPKVILHEHVEGSVSAALAVRLAARHGVSVSNDFITDGQYNYDHRDFLDFIRIYDQISDLVRSPQDYFLVLEDFLQRNAAQGLVYCEFLASPFHFCGHQDADGRISFDAVKYHAVVDAMAQAIEQLRASHGVETCLQMVGVRHLGAAAMQQLAQFLLDNPRQIVTGFNIAGDEKSGHFADFSQSYALIGQSGLGRSYHAGEICGAQSVWQALEAGAQRIGHGVRSIDDPLLIAELIAKQVTLEVSLTSNYQLVNDYDRNWANHPLRRLYDSGVRLCLNTDDAGIFATDIGHEYQLAAEQFAFSRIELLDITLCALEASFAPLALRQRLIGQVYQQMSVTDINAIQQHADQAASTALRQRLLTRIADCKALRD